jgi:hypothetical protein
MSNTVIPAKKKTQYEGFRSEQKVNRGAKLNTIIANDRNKPTYIDAQLPHVKNI